MDDKFEMKRKNFPEDIPKDMLEFTFCGAYRNVDFSGYESPIQVFEKDLGVKITQEIEHTVFRKVMKLGVSIDKDKLMRALEYDRNQYAEGYNQGYRAGLESAQPKWVSVWERLPNDKEAVLTYKNGMIRVQVYEKKRNGWIQDGWFMSMATVTHWMPLPEPPKYDGHD